MKEVITKEGELPNSYRVINIEKVDDYLFVETDKTSLLIDENKNVYDVGKYRHAVRTYKMGDDLVAVLEGNYKQDLVNIKTKEVYVSHSTSYYSGIYKIDDDFVYFSGPDYNKRVFNIRTRKFIEPQVDIEVDYSSIKVSDNLFMYCNNEIHQNFLVNQDGDLVYKCGAYFPYFKDGNLILSSPDKDRIIIIHDLYKDSRRTEVLTMNEVISSNLLVHITDHEPDSICFVSGKKFMVVDFDMNVVKNYPLDIDYDKVEIQLFKDMAVILASKGETTSCVGLNIDSGVQIKHHGIWVLPFDGPGEQVIRGHDELDTEDYIFTLYDLEGNEYTHHRARDCFNVHSKAMNKYIFYGIDGTNNNLVYNIDTKEEKIIPWTNPTFNSSNEDIYTDVGFGIRCGDIRDDVIIDFFDEDLNILFEGLVAKYYNIRPDRFTYELKNNLLFLTIRISCGGVTNHRKVVLDMNHNVIYDDYVGHLSFIGNFLQVLDGEEGKTYYIDSRTGKRIDDMSITMNEFALPDTLNVGGEQVQLVKKN